MKLFPTLLAQILLVTLLGMVAMVNVNAETDIEKLTKVLNSDGISGLASLIEGVKPVTPHLPSLTDVTVDQATVDFGRDLLKQINLQVSGTSPPEAINMITSLLTIHEWLKKQPSYGNLVLCHRILDVAGALAIEKLTATSPPSEDLLRTAESVAAKKIVPIFRAQVLDQELGTQLFANALTGIGNRDGEQLVRKLWKNLSFLGFCEKSPNPSPDLNKMKQSVLESLGTQSTAFVDLAKIMPAKLLVPQSLEATSTELLETKNFWFVSMASAPANLREVLSVLEYLKVTKQLPSESVGANEDEVRDQFSAQWASATTDTNTAIPYRAAEITFRARSGLPLDRDSKISVTKGNTP